MVESVKLMHTIEPYYKWRDIYSAESDERSPFYGREYDEFSFSQKIYNYYIHPQWDDFGSSTLYAKILYVDYSTKFAVIELIGEWNDCLHNDIMFFKREVIEPLIENGIEYYAVACENVLNFHGSDDCYYEEWQEEVSSYGGWISFINLFKHVEDEMHDVGIQFHVNIGPHLNEIHWRGRKPQHLFDEIELRMNSSVRQLGY